jgi:hypothetical protein
VVLAVLTGVWVTGGRLTDDELISKGLTLVWLSAAGALGAIVARRWRPLAVPVLGAWLATSVASGGYLLYASTVDRVVDEQVVSAPEAPAPTADAPDSSAGRDSGRDVPGPVGVAAGEFRSQAHETSGTATVIEQSDGSRVLTLTGFATDPGPDLRVYLTSRDGEVDGAVDLGALKGNKGDQQYSVPKDAEPGAVVIWCRAFSVAFGTATLTT